VPKSPLCSALLPSTGGFERFARGGCELPLLKAIKAVMLAAKIGGIRRMSAKMSSN
jgi:hypothetical protein